MCMLAAVIFLGGSVSGDKATTPSPSVLNFTTPVKVSWTEAERAFEQSRDGVTPTAAQTKLLSTTRSSSSVKDPTDVSEDREKLKNNIDELNPKDKKEELGKNKRKLSTLSY